MKKLLILFLFCTIQGYAQTVPDSLPLNISPIKAKLDKHDYFRLMVIKSMTNSINYDKLMKAPAGFGQLASVSIIFNKAGLIDTAIINVKANQHFELKKNPTAELRNFKPVLEYANTIVILPILYIRSNEVCIDLKNTFLTGFMELLPTNLLNKRMNIVFLKPEINPFSQVR